MSEAARQTRWLAIAEDPFVPSDSGGRVESINLLRAASVAGITLHVIVPGLVDADVRAHEDALPGVRIEGIPRRPGLASHASVRPFLFVSRPLPPDLVERLRREHAAEPYDAVLAVSFRVAHLGELVATALGLPLLVRPHNIESEYFHQLTRGLGPVRGLPYLLEGWKLKRAERAVHASGHVTAFADISEADARSRAAMTAVPVVHVPPFLPPRPPAEVVPRHPSHGTGRTVLFLGSLDNGNNVDGIRWFTGRCWAALRRRRPDAVLHVVGRRATPALRSELAAAGAAVSVDVPSVAPHLEAADVFVNPVRRGAGVNIKMIEAMAAGLPVVSTTVGARGMHWEAGEHLLVADDPPAFAAAVALLLEDADLRARIAQAGREFVGTELDGAAQIRRMQKLLGG